MRKRSTDILEKMLKNPSHGYVIADLADQYEVTVRTMRNDIKEINEFLEIAGAPQLDTDTGGVVRISEGMDLKRILKQLHNMDPYLYRFSAEERMIFVVMMLSGSSNYITMKQIADAIHVSRVTIVNDVELIKDKIESRGAELVLDPGKGMLLRADDATKLHMLTEMLLDVDEKSYFFHFLMNQTDVRFRISKIRTTMREYMKTNQLVLAEKTLRSTIYYAFVLFNYTHPEGAPVSSDEGFTSLEGMLLYAALQLRIPITYEMMERFRAFVTSENLQVFVRKVDEIALYKVVVRFLKAVDEELDLDLPSDAKLISALIKHIQNMRNWDEYEVDLPAEQEVFVDYAQMQRLMDEHAHILEKYLRYELTPNMKKLLIIHICVSLIRNQRYMIRYQVVIVCPGNAAIARFLEAQIDKNFDFTICDVVTEEKEIPLLAERFPNVDFILSTVALEDMPAPVIRIHPFLKIEDMNLIQQSVFRQQSHQLKTLHERENYLKSFIKDLFYGELAEKLCDETGRIIEAHRVARLKKAGNEISAILPESHLLFAEKGEDWRSAIRHAGRPLVKENLIEQRYLEKSIEQVELYGDYIIVSEGVALAHAGKEYGVNQDCLSLLVSEEGIVFFDPEKKVHLLFCLASTGEHDNLKLLQQIVRLGQIEGLVQQICRLKTPGDIRHQLAITETE